MRRSLATSLLALTAFASAPAMGQTPKPADDARLEARRRFDAGLKLSDQGDYRAALAEFKRAYDLAPTASVLYNIALINATLGRPVEAVAALDQMLSREALSPLDATRARQLREEQWARVAEVEITTNAEGARIEIDGIDVAKLPLERPLRVAAGEHILGVVAPGYAPLRKEVSFAGGLKKTIAFDLTPLEGKMAHLAVRTKLAGALVLANAQPIGRTPLETTVTLAPGEYRIVVKRPGYREAEARLVLGDGATAEIAPEPEEDPAAPPDQKGAVLLQISESGATCAVDGRVRSGCAEPIALPIGPHRVVVERAGFFPWERDVEIAPRTTKTTDVRLQPTSATRAELESSASRRKTWSWVALGAGAVLAGVGTGLVVASGPKIDSAQAELDQVVRDGDSGGVCDPKTAGPQHQSADVCVARFDDATNKLDSAKLTRTLGWASMGVGAAAVVTGVVLLVTTDRADRYGSREGSGTKTALRPFGGVVAAGALFGLSGTF